MKKRGSELQNEHVNKCTVPEEGRLHGTHKYDDR